MLTEKTLYEAEILARDLTARGISLKLLPDNPLFDLTAACTPMEKVFNSPLEAVKAAANVSRGINFDGTIKHSDDLRKYAWGIGQSLNTVINIARNTINPMVKEINDIIDKRIDTEINYNIGLTVKCYFLPEIMKGGVLDDLTDRYKNVGYSLLDWSSTTWPVMTSEFLRQSAKKNSNTLNKQVDKFLDGVDDDLIVDIYDYLFRLKFLNNFSIDENIIYILGFLWSSLWLNDLPEGLNGNLKELSLDLTSLKSNCGKHIQDNLKRFERMSNQNYFILKTPNLSADKKTFYVQGEIYNKWLGTDGSPELLIGSWLANNSGSLNDITDQQKTEWTRRFRLDSEVRRQLFDTKKQTIITKELSDFIDQVIEERKLDRTNVREKFNALIKNRPYRVSKCLLKWLRMILCDTLYAQTDILTVLNRIDDILVKESETPPREAATVAAIDLVVDWMYSAIKVNLVKS